MQIDAKAFALGNALRAYLVGRGAKRVVPYLTFASAEPFTIGVANTMKIWDGTLYYSTDTTTWSEWDGNTIASAEHNGEQRIYIRGINNSRIVGSSYTYPYRWLIEGNYVRCDGNIETLLDYEMVMRGEHPKMADYCFAGMFQYASKEMGDDTAGLTKAPELPATELSKGCYAEMFSFCMDLEYAPKLPAMVLTESCYEKMFDGCGFKSVPELPATTLAKNCYRYMFEHYSGSVAPKLPAVNLAEGCYIGMFWYSEHLTTAPELPATTLAKNCYFSMFEECTSLVAPPKLPATTLASYCYYQMFEGCIRLEMLPKLPATALPEICYTRMFAGCTGIKLSATQTGDYITPYRIPVSGNGAEEDGSVTGNMFANTGGAFTGTPEINTTYYLHESNSIV